MINNDKKSAYQREKTLPLLGNMQAYQPLLPNILSLHQFQHLYTLLSPKRGKKTPTQDLNPTIQTHPQPSINFFTRKFTLT